RYFGQEGLAERIREHCRLAQLFAHWVEESPAWEVLAPVPFSLVCFRACPRVEGEADEARNARLDALNEQLMNAVNATGEAFLSHTKLGGVLSLRLAIGNIRTTEEHIRRAWELLNEELSRLA
ncbi:MAG: amino acid decarboxylase, partial [Acidobacteria bacterium]|nr:amino acid decarboxylase [Acidobacteriota bacterium]